ncbi:GNAT family N-acetyltransferase [Pediococcus ethanolidurans]|uniref:GNAT family N-acetyltransferase n=1 Tax=Pediococcus ethanolidurans TaxID=319653 RepID=UPI0029530791|nr:GNAT family N-acetyltransferase [Pediococcus ethanolidurans]
MSRHKFLFHSLWRQVSWRLLTNLKLIALSQSYQECRLATKYFYIENNIIKGGISCRWELNDYLAKYGGNIGYGVAPNYRKQGIATEMLRQAVKLFQQRHLDKVLITAEDWNVASQRVIESAGGVYENTLIEESTGYRLKRYWIDLTT